MDTVEHNSPQHVHLKQKSEDNNEIIPDMVVVEENRVYLVEVKSAYHDFPVSSFDTMIWEKYLRYPLYDEQKMFDNPKLKMLYLHFSEKRIHKDVFKYCKEEGIEVITPTKFKSSLEKIQANFKEKLKGNDLVSMYDEFLKTTLRVARKGETYKTLYKLVDKFSEMT